VGLTDVRVIGAVALDLAGEELAEMAEMAAAGCVAFSDDGRPVLHSGTMRRALEYARHLGFFLPSRSRSCR
jgi:dihydroorotase